MGALQSIILLNKISSYSYATYHSIFSLLQYNRNYIYDTHNKWVFIPEHTCPVPLQYIKNSVLIDWVYHSTTNVLSSCTTYTSVNSSTIDLSENEYHKLNWLSARVSIDTEHSTCEYDMDEFLSTLLICSSSKIPNLFCIFMIWCVYTQQWFSSTSDVVFHIIDSDGIEHNMVVNTDAVADICPVYKLDKTE